MDRTGSAQRRSSKLAAMAIAWLCAGALSIGAAVIGYSEAAQSLTEQRIATLPKNEQPAWRAYLQRSQRQEQVDRASLEAERKGMTSLPPLPELSSSARSLPIDRDAGWYSSPEARHIADVIVSFQIPSGGWGKNMNMAGALRVRGQSYVSDNLNRFPSPGDFDAPRDPNWHYVGTLDNDATTTEMHFLARVQASISPAEGEAYRASFLRGVHYLLESQYPNGGWPQVWPLEGGYHDAITFNDDAVYNATTLLMEVANGAPDVSFVPRPLRTQASAAAARAIRCILAAQVVLHGQKTLWGQQTDMLTLQPVAARNFEPAALCTDESSHLLELLMHLPYPTPQVEVAVSAGVTWLRQHAIYNESFTSDRKAPEGRHLVAQPGAGPLWARYYSLQTERPVFGDRDKSIHDDVNDLSRERRNGYSWFNREPSAVIDEYATWSKAHPGSAEISARSHPVTRG